MSLTRQQVQALGERLRAAAAQINGRPVAEHLEKVLAQPAHKSHEAREQRRRKDGE